MKTIGKILNYTIASWIIMFIFSAIMAGVFSHSITFLNTLIVIMFVLTGLFIIVSIVWAIGLIKHILK